MVVAGEYAEAGDSLGSSGRWCPWVGIVVAAFVRRAGASATEMLLRSGVRPCEGWRDSLVVGVGVSEALGASMYRS
jgi:hypothetical protein